MTSSNQKFVISGDRDDLLKEVLKLIDFMEKSPLNPDKRPVKGMVINDDKLEFLWHTESRNSWDSLYNINVSKLVPIDCVNTFDTVKNWLSTMADYSNADGENYGDGGTKKGWIVELCEESHSGYEFYVVFNVKPFWTYYSK